MELCVCNGAMLGCSFGTAPALLVVPPRKKPAEGQAVATIMDNKPLVNILPFGMCSSIANPTVAAATAAAMGVFTPMPCIPVTSMPWTPASPTVLIDGKPALGSTSQCICNWGGVISITSPGSFTVEMP